MGNLFLEQASSSMCAVSPKQAFRNKIINFSWHRPFRNCVITISLVFIKTWRSGENFHGIPNRDMKRKSLLYASLMKFSSSDLNGPPVQSICCASKGQWNNLNLIKIRKLFVLFTSLSSVRWWNIARACTHSSSVIEKHVNMKFVKLFFRKNIINRNWILFNFYFVYSSSLPARWKMKICSEFPCSSFDKFNFRSIKKFVSSKFLCVLLVQFNFVGAEVKCSIRGKSSKSRKHIKLLRSPLSINLLLDFFSVLSAGFTGGKPITYGAANISGAPNVTRGENR